MPDPLALPGRACLHFIPTPFPQFTFDFSSIGVR
jgi:hypothetical protein